MRLVRSTNVCANDFRSCHAEGKRQPKKCDECRWHACSVWVEATPFEKLADLVKLPNLTEMKFIAHISVTATSGCIKPHEKDKQHISFWIVTSFRRKSLLQRLPQYDSAC